MVVKPGLKGDFKVVVSGHVILDKNADETPFTRINAAADLCPEGQPKPFPKAAAAVKVSNAIQSVVEGRALKANKDGCAGKCPDTKSGSATTLDESMSTLQLAAAGVVLGVVVGVAVSALLRQR